MRPTHLVSVSDWFRVLLWNVYADRYSFACPPTLASPVMWHYPEVINTAAKTLRAAQILDMPVFVTEQYPKGLFLVLLDMDRPDSIDAHVQHADHLSLSRPGSHC